ncbi:RSP_2648 family PIN domain-containing protein [Wenxinia saemankumensis]|uniref:PIN domain-containing protein n=1 Tax=Wenxinia saemankumensis TaxID=1447782 RepID=A0A1M6HGF4_9RHOB|nr:PIN domain-containing protein [Wenxinia saemankumensis]SHJ21253.1 PIN domain-containing protein [Wenxinia saemankumensis]
MNGRGGPRVLIDANVLYPTVMREVVLGVASEGLFVPRWTARIAEEWARAAARLGPEAERIARTDAARAAEAFPQALITSYEHRERGLRLPDPADVHVLAAAIHGSCDIILTSNARDFPRGLLAEWGLERQDPDQLMRALYDRAPDPVEAVVARTLATARALSGTDWTARALLKKARLPKLAKAVG